ncbi:DNA mismatch repair endonuclease MutL [Floridanema aerugineum]|uniref:DNA mismatch repair protein MutL n=1 Tax=Floridaenema aerugineum BLCC-F46 TaxID=3153654 RepID=A0ABV4X884_9CYAN
MASSLIQSLPKEVVNLIAAGEVIDSLAAVVRELVENSLDAGATRIVISVWADLWRIRVADNGCGMDLDNLRLAATAHSTSKIHDYDDLWKITTLGFRGEALHSLAQLSDLQIASRAIDNSEGWRILYDNLGEPVIEEAIAIAPGTIVTVSNLFGNWPVRRQGLPTPVQQMRSLQAMIHQIAICHPQITWQVEQSDRPWFTISPGTTAQDILPQIIRDLKLGDLQHLKVELLADLENSEYLELVLGLPDRCHRRRSDWVKVATNGRIIKSSEIEQTILTAFARTLPRDRFPVCFLHLKISPNQIDWNRHPAKAEIYLHSISYLQKQILSAIEQALNLNPNNISETAHNQRVGKLLTAAEEKASYKIDRTIQPETAKKDQINLMELRAVAQVNNTYIVAEHPAGLWLIEQHIAHERVLYEQICQHWQIVPLEPPIILNQLSPQQLEQLQHIGLEIEIFGEQIWAIRSAPALLSQRPDCADALRELSLGGDLQTAQVAVACRSAIRNGTPLTLPEMQTLIEQWQRTRHPRTCPHGRPIFLSLEETALARFFRRHWVIGKSHGI